MNDDLDGTDNANNVESEEKLGEYAEQYNANHDFAIFQANNDAVGGLMNL